MMTRNDDINHKLSTLEHVCKEKSIDVFHDGMKTSFQFKTEKNEILFTLLYNEFFKSYSLIIDYNNDNSFSSSWNLFTTLPDMIFRITELIGFYTEKPISVL